ncbi:MAG: EAL domain-containing protein [Betaproteobacteria bacterium]|nr:EAL domain-containing protein [Betaproteobacteria bacterium]
MTHAMPWAVGAAPDAAEVAERKTFLEFTDADAERLSRLHAVLQASEDSFVQRFYDHLFQFPRLQTLLPDQDSLERLKRTQAQYFSRLTEGDYGADYVADRLRVGRVHQHVGLEPKWYIGAYRKYLSGLLPLIWEQCDGDGARFLELNDSLLKLVLFDMGLALDSYFEADYKALREMRDYADHIIHTMPCGLMVLDEELRVRTVNLAACEMLGVDGAASTQGMTLDLLLPGAALAGLARQVLTGDDPAPRTMTLGPMPDRGGRIYAVTLSSTRMDEARTLIIQLEDETESVRVEESLLRFRTALDVSEDAIFLIDQTSQRFVDVNEAACKVLGYSRRELLGMGPAAIKPLLDEAELARRFEQIVKAPHRSGRIETLHRRKDGSLFPVEVALRAFRSEGQPMLVAVARDVSARKHAEESLLLARRALESSGNGIVITDCQQPDNPIVYVNPAFERITGYRTEEVLGRNCRFLHGDDRLQPGILMLQQRIEEQTDVRVTLRNYRKDGSLFWNELYVAPVRAEDGAVTHFVGVQNDITERKRAEEHLLHIATHDSLTGLPNRNLLHDRVEQAIGFADRMRKEVAILFIDIDRFKNINDSLGHAAGDTLIVTLAHRLRESVRMTDTVARVGGDEFVVVLTDLQNKNDIGQVLNNLIAAINLPAPVGGHELTVSASIGVSVYPQDGRDVASLLKNADTAMYRAKEAGRSAFRFYAQEMNADAMDRLRLENDLRNAVKGDELLLYYQPQIEVTSGRVLAAEALLRWRHPQRGLVSPIDFIPLAEESGLIVPIGVWVLRQACAQLRDWRDAGLPVVRVAINLSPRQFRQGNVLEAVRTALADFDLPPDLLELEITESSLIHNPQETAAVLDELSRSGLHISVDDFGTGYSSLAHLKCFPLNALKIDRSFIADIETNRDSAAISTAVIALAHGLGLKVVAEGVERPSQMQRLRELGCDMVQGYLHGRPMPSESFEALITA